MSTRLPTGGRFINRSKPLNFRFNSRKLKGFEGDTVASALMANDQKVVGRSFKYHRPRGIVASGPEEPNALFTIGKDGEQEPNQVGTITELAEGLEVKSQNHWPTLETDIGSMANLGSNLIPAGFYYKTFMAPRQAWKHLFEPAIRQSAGLGQPPTESDVDHYEHFYLHTDILVVGGGVAGLLATKLLAETGLRILLLEQLPNFGGRLVQDHAEFGEGASQDWVNSTLQELSASKNVTMRSRTSVSGIYDHGFVIADERLPNTSGMSGYLKRRLWKIRTKRIVLATGAIERPLCFAGNDLPGVRLASGVRDYLINYGVSPGDRTAIITNNDDAYRTAIVLAEVGLSVPLILDTRMEIRGTLPTRAKNLGLRIEPARGIGEVLGKKTVSGLEMCSQVGEGTSLEKIGCESIAVSGGWSPTVHLWSHCNGKLKWDETKVMFVPDWKHPPIDSHGKQNIFPVGSANGYLQLHEISSQVEQIVRQVAREFDKDLPEIQRPHTREITEDRCYGTWLIPYSMKPKKKMKAWVDYQNDVKVSDIDLAVLEGFESIEHSKRYTTLGMATDQGKTSNVNGIALVSHNLGIPMDKVGTTTFRPPYSPIPLGAIAGSAGKELFKPTRKTPIDAWHVSQNAHWEPVSDWRRPYCYLLEGESVENAVNRETLRVRTTVGMLDATTLGKILVKGKDAARFLDLIYTNAISTLKPGRCRYGLMCDENGFLMDDGVVARLDETTFLCHTTTGGADHIHGWLEDWLQCEWWDWRVYTANITDQYVQIGVAGPEARNVLDKLGGMDLGEEALPFMSWKKGILGGHEVQVYRISFSGELSFEISVRASEGLELWEKIHEAGQEFSIEPYGTEALHVLRAEKGFIMIGDETDGTTIPQDLGLDWAISKKKDDFLGKRGQQRSYLNDPNRWKLVSLEVLDNDEPLPHGVYAQGETKNEFDHPRMEGRVTSTYYSPILKRPIAMGLVERGTERMGEVIKFNCGNKMIKAKIVSHIAYNTD